MSKTPETDAAFKDFNDGSNTAFLRMTVHAQRLEEQRDRTAELLRDTTEGFERALRLTPIRDADEVIARAKSFLREVGGK